jgi:hypothetical protein
MKTQGLVLLAVVLALSWASHARAEMITFDELPSQQIDGLTLKGVTFHFSVNGSPSSDATYSSSAPGNLVFLNVPSMEGDTAGQLTLDFAAPTQLLQFGLALSTNVPVLDGASVELFSPGNTSLGVGGLALLPQVVFAEGMFDYYGDPVSRAVITFNSGAAPRFALDNLTFQANTVQTPEPASLALFGVGLAALGLARRRRVPSAN